MTLNDFVKKYDGKCVDWDSHYGFQCVDLYRQYVKEVLDLPQTPPVVGAKDIWTSDLTNFEKITNTPDGFPLPGDVMIWGAKYGPFGHVAICTAADVNTFTCFSQNDPVGSPCVIKTYKNWSYLLGWLRAKPKANTYRGYDLTNQDSMKIAVDKMCDILDGKYISIDEHNKIINGLDSKSTEAAQNYAKDKQILEEKISALDQALRSLQDTEHTWETTADDYQRKLKAVCAIISGFGVEVYPESSQEVLENALLNATSDAETKLLYTKIREVLMIAKDTPEAVLSGIQDLKKGYENKISLLTKKDNAVKTMTFGKYIIKFYLK